MADPTTVRSQVETAIAPKRALGKRDLARVQKLLAEADRLARSRLASAAQDAEEIFAGARAEAQAILTTLPDFGAMEAMPNGQVLMRIIRRAADRYGLPIAAVTGHSPHEKASLARAEAVRDIANAFPKMPDRVLGYLFSGISESRIRRAKRGGAA